MDFFPGYRYCGPGKSGPGAPINELDAICMRHDACYRKSESRKLCDVMFLQQIEPFVSQSTPMGRDAALMRLAIRVKLMFLS
jgi:hypothetical protein